MKQFVVSETCRPTPLLVHGYQRPRYLPVSSGFSSFVPPQVLCLVKRVKRVSIGQNFGYLNSWCVQNTFVASCIATDAYIFI